jgi:type I restriction enzyme S subunit
MFDGPFGSALKTSDYTTEGFRVARLENIGHLRFRGELNSFVSEEKFLSLSRHVLKADDVLFSSFVDKQTRVCLVPAELDGRMINKADCFCVRARSDGYDARLLAYRLAAPASYAAFSDAVRGVTRPRIGLKDLAGYELEVPPLAEQRRIVAKLDVLTARTARARADLDRIPALAVRYKQAVLAKAFGGELTAEWRAGKPNLMSARAIRGAIQASWEATQTSTSRRRGPVADPEAGRQPVELGALPGSWVQMDLASITDPSRLIQYGILKPGDHIDGGVPYVKVMNIKGGVVELGKIRRTTPEIHEAYRRSMLRQGDLLLTIRGTVGRVAEVPVELNGGNITQDSVRIAVLPSVSRRFVYWFLHSPAAQEYFRANQKGVAVRGINVGDVRPMELPVCSPEEQEEIVRRVDHAMIEIDRLTAEAAAARRLLDRLDQSVLAKAFRGDLVLQDPADEPASVLLERIRAERVAAPKVARGRRKAVA